MCYKVIKFVRVQLTLDFTPLVNAVPPGPTVLRSTFYIKLPQTFVGLVNNSRVNYTLLTFHGPADLCTLTPTKVRTQILDLTLQQDPQDLLPPSFNVRMARTDSTALRIDINSKILRLAFATICKTLFMEFCPGYSNQPHAVLNHHIRQVHVDAVGNQVSSTAQAYFQQLMSAARPFSNQQEFPVSICQRFMDNLDPRLMTGFATVSQTTVYSNRSMPCTSVGCCSSCCRLPNKLKTTLPLLSALPGRQLDYPRPFPQTPPRPAVPSKQMHSLARPKLLSLGTPKVLMAYPKIEAGEGIGLSLAMVAVAPMPIRNMRMALQPSSALIVTTRVSKRMQHTIWKKCAEARRNVTFTTSSART